MKLWIDKNRHYFILMHPLESFLGMCFTLSNTREKWVEWEIIENRYKLTDGYKVELKSVEDGYGTDTFYQDDFKSLIENGMIIPKTNGNQCIKEIVWIEPLCGSAYIKHSAYIVTNG